MSKKTTENVEACPVGRTGLFSL